MNYRKRKKHIAARQRYELKRQAAEYKEVKREALKQRRLRSPPRFARQGVYIPPINHRAPAKLSFIDNTNEILDYLEEAKYYLTHGSDIHLDISRVKELTPDCIPVLISHIKDAGFKRYGGVITGNAPNDAELQKLFTESGFYEYVKSKKKFPKRATDLMHKESNTKVKTEIAGRATRIVNRDFEYDEDETEAIYNIFIELMSNTHHHANPNTYGYTKWWLYVYGNEKDCSTSICFLDMGVGIFKSVVVRDYVKRLKLKLKMVDNTSLVDSLFSGEIGSRIDVDNAIRGKGIPQVVGYAKMDIFSKAYLITNNVKVNIKTAEKTKLKSNFAGTFLYFELKRKKVEDAQN